MRLNETSIYTEPLKFSPDSFPTGTSSPDPEPISDVNPGGIEDTDAGDEDGQGETEEEKKEGEEGMLEDEESPPWITDDRRLRRRQWDIIDSITEGVKGASTPESDTGATESSQRQDEGSASDGEGEGNTVYEVPTYSGAIHYKVPKTGYYCVGTSLPCSLRLHHPSTLPPVHPPLPPPPHFLTPWLNPTICPSPLFMTKYMVKKLTCRDRTSNTPKPTIPPNPLLRLHPRIRKETSKPRRIFRLRPV